MYSLFKNLNTDLFFPHFSYTISPQFKLDLIQNSYSDCQESTFPSFLF